MKKYGFRRRKAILASSRIFVTVEVPRLAIRWVACREVHREPWQDMSALRPHNLRSGSKRLINVAHNAAHHVALIHRVGFAEAAEGLVDDNVGDLDVEV